MNALALATEELLDPSSKAENPVGLAGLASVPTLPGALRKSQALRPARPRQPRFNLISAALLVVVFGFFGLWINS
jgi:hypothetical protein